eukprot:3025461-Pyramimonas_sp.AAC.1
MAPVEVPAAGPQAVEGVLREGPFVLKFRGHPLPHRARQLVRQHTVRVRVRLSRQGTLPQPIPPPIAPKGGKQAVRVKPSNGLRTL